MVPQRCRLFALCVGTSFFKPYVDNSGRWSVSKKCFLSSISYNDEYWVWNANTIQTRKATFQIYVEYFSPDMTDPFIYLSLLVTWPKKHNPFQQLLLLAGDPRVGIGTLINVADFFQSLFIV